MGSEGPLIAIAIVAGLGGPARADGDAPTVAAPDKVVGDGRTATPIAVRGGALTHKIKQLPVPEVATITCPTAPTLAAVGKLEPSLLAPAVTAAETIECVAKLRDGEQPFRISVGPPPAGLYARAVESDVRSTAREVHLDAFEWTGTARVAPHALRAAASDGTITGADGKLVLALTGNAPRVVAIALAEGDRLGAAFVPVTGVTTVPVEAEAGSSVQFWIAGRWFGPVKAEGRIAQIPIEVPAGVTHGVARATARNGYVTDAVTDLKVPAHPRIAAMVASPELHIGDQVTIAIAVASADARPADAAVPVLASAQRGKLEATQALGGGLWSVRYTAPDVPGPDRITFRVDRDARAGTATLDLTVAAGRPARIELDVPAGPVEPGGEVTATAHVFDAAGNPVGDAKIAATIAGAALVATGGETIALHGRVPERVPAGPLALVVTAGTARATRDLSPRFTADTATVHALTDGREASAEVIVRDRFGNLVPAEAFQLAVTGAKVAHLDRDPAMFHAALVANADAAEARLVVRAGDRQLADERVAFEPPPEAIVLGAWASGGIVDNLGVLITPRAAAGFAVRRGIGGLEIAVLLGAEGFRFRDTTTVPIGSDEVSARRTLTGIGGVAEVRARFRLARRFGLAIGLAAVPTRMHAQLQAENLPADDDRETVIVVRGLVQGDFKLGPGRFFVGAGYGRGRLSQGVVVGRVDGLAAFAGYEWWFADLGW